MKKLAIALAALGMGLTACEPGTVPPASPGAVAETQVIDEQAALAVELAYKGARMAVELAVDSGVLKGDAAAKVALLDKRAYAAVLATRKAYDAGNSADYLSAATTARAAINDLLAAIRG